MDVIDEAIEELIRYVPAEHRENRPFIAKTTRIKARIKCRELGAILGFTPSQISEIENGSLDVPDDVIISWFMVCGSKVAAKKAMANE